MQSSEEMTVLVLPQLTVLSGEMTMGRLYCLLPNTCLSFYYNDNDVQSSEIFRESMRIAKMTSTKIH